VAKSVYVSSTFVDLAEHRAAAVHMLGQMRHTSIAMEAYVARDARVVDQCLEDVARCDIYMGIFAWRYGYVPGSDNPEALSVTEIEYQHARTLGKPRLLFTVPADAPWPDQFRDTVTGDSGRGAAVERLRNIVDNDRLPGRFATPDDLARVVAASIHLLSSDAKSRAMSPDLASASCLTLQTSETPEIVANITRSIDENARTGLIKIQLGKEKQPADEREGWWSTRLHLLAALCADYTDVRQLLFESEGFRLVGMCTPKQAQRALARSYPEVELAYRDSLPEPSEAAMDPVQDIKIIVDRFSARMDALGGEPKVKRWVAPRLVAGWPRMTQASVEVPRSGVTPDLLATVAQRPEPYVVLVRNGIVQQVVDREGLSTRIAEAVV
jgi:uncharacterized protein DUF4062